MAILLVDDNQIALDLQKFMFESYGIEVDTADNGAKAISLAKQNDYAAIVTDVDMPEIDGFEVARQIRACNKAVPIVALTNEEIADNDGRYLECGMNGVLQKPLKLADIKTVLSPYVIEIIQSTNAQFSRKTDVIFDGDELLSVLSDERALKQLLQQFLRAHGRDGIKIKELFEQGNYPPAIELLHDLVGVAGNLYCGRLYEASSRFAAELTSGFINPRSVQQFNTVWQKTIGQLSERCVELTTKYHSKHEPSADWSEIWHDFCELCQDFDVEATNLFNENISVFQANLSEKDFEFLHNAVNRYDYLSVINTREGK